MMIRWLCLSLLVVTASGELFTALADLEELLQTESVLLRTLEEFINQQEHRIDQLKRRLRESRKENELANEDVQQYLTNPINAYLLVKRLTVDWKKTEVLMSDDISKDVMQNLTEFKTYLKFPSDEDLTGAAAALMRLQDTYMMDTASLARGELNGVQYSSQLSSGDCFELGRQSYYNEDFYHTVLWMNEALRRYEIGKPHNETNPEKWEILEYLAYSTYKQGNVLKALHLTDELLEIVPTHQRALGNKVYYQEAIEKGVPSDSPTNVREMKEKSWLDANDRELYEMGCRNKLSPSPDYLAQLKCRYVHFNRPYLRIAPLKEEEAFLKPRIVIFRQAMYDSEIETIKKMATPRLKRATVQNYKTGELETASYRISKSAWLKEEEDSVVATVGKRVEDMTGLTIQTAEELQVVNYGIGGHYDPHFDFARKEETNAFKSLGTGNRIATVLFYMSDVAQGGATVFPLLKLALWPEKGSAAFWYNLHSTGEGDYDTRHAACPVLAGSKWVSNRWLHERGQEFRRPCLPGGE